MKLKDALEIRDGEVISLVGAGGKTTIMFRLAGELAAGGRKVITTTTTKIREPSASETQLLILEKDEQELLEAIPKSVKRYEHITVASEKLPLGKLRGIRPELVTGIAGLNLASCIIVEADGAKQRPLKAPSATEPVIPANTSLVIPVVGVEAVGCRLTEKDVFRPEIVSRLLGINPGEIIDVEAVALLMTHSQSIIRGSPSHARIVPFINKVDIDGKLAIGRKLAEKILDVGNPQIERVVLGQAKQSEPVLEVITRSIIT